MEKMIDGEMLNVPEHVAIILDGNGRWAKKRFMPRNYGHMQGAKTVEDMCEVILASSILRCMLFQRRTGSVRSLRWMR